MTGTILDYIKEYGDTSFAEMPFNDVDSLCLCQLSYLKFDGMVPDVRRNEPGVTLREIAAHADYEKLFADERYEKVNRGLMEGMLAGRRYADMKLNCYINMVEKEWETQFSAVTFFPAGAPVYVAFRGTDETIVGWKEDFNMAFIYPVPGQSYSVKYLNMVAGRMHCPFLVGGHSKGGNLAVYSAMNCLPQIQQHIQKVYSMDGPGFRPEVLEQCDYEKIADRVVKYLPHSSMIGMIFERDIHYRVVESKSFGLAQHNPYTWLAKDGRFVECDDIYESRKFFDTAMNDWILSLNAEQLRIFVDTLYQVISASKADNLIDFTADWKKSMNGIVAAWKELDEQTAQMLKEIIRSLFDLTRIRMKEEVGAPFEELRRKSDLRAQQRARRKKERAMRRNSEEIVENPDVPDAIAVPAPEENHE